MPPVKKKEKNVKRGIPDDSAIKVVLPIPDSLLELNEKVESILNLPKPHLSPSSINLYQTCGYRFMENYVNDNKGGSSIPMVEGTTHHSTFEFNNRYKKKTGKDRPIKKLIEHFCDNFHDNWKDIDNKKGGTEREVIIRGRKIQTKYSEIFAPKFIPVLIEQEFHLMVGPVKILCYMDVSGKLKPIKGRGGPKDVVCDYKVSGRIKPSDEVNDGIQLTTYGICDKAARKLDGLITAGFCTCVKSAIPSVVWQPGVVDDKRIKRFISTVLNVALSISKGDFPTCKSAGGLCSPKWCDYWCDCPNNN